MLSSNWIGKSLEKLMPVFLFGMSENSDFELSSTQALKRREMKQSKDMVEYLIIK